LWLFLLEASAATHAAELVTAGGIELLVDAMRTHARHAPVQDGACRVFTRARMLCPDDAKARALAAGMLPAIIARLQLMGAPTPKQALGALNVILKGDAAAAHADSLHSLAPAVVAAMRGHVADAEMQQLCINVLMYAAVDASCAATAAEAGGIAAIVARAVRAYLKVKGIRERGCIVLDSLLRHECVDAARAVREGALIALREGLASRPRAVAAVYRPVMLRLQRAADADGGGAGAGASAGGVESAAAAAAPTPPATARADPRCCAACGAAPAGGAALRACARCRRARYCGAACQRTHWKAHKPACNAAAAPDRV
jgi:hypothetical protein